MVLVRTTEIQWTVAKQSRRLGLDALLMRTQLNYRGMRDSTMWFGSNVPYIPKQFLRS